MSSYHCFRPDKSPEATPASPAPCRTVTMRTAQRYQYVLHIQVDNMVLKSAGYLSFEQALISEPIVITVIDLCVNVDTPFYKQKINAIYY